MSLWEVTEEVRRLLQQHGNVTIDTDKYVGRTCYPILNEAWQDGDNHFTVEGAPANRRKNGHKWNRIRTWKLYARKSGS